VLYEYGTKDLVDFVIHPKQASAVRITIATGVVNLVVGHGRPTCPPSDLHLTAVRPVESIDRAVCLSKPSTAFHKGKTPVRCGKTRVSSVFFKVTGRKDGNVYIQRTSGRERPRPIVRTTLL
jgi:hypothetical protein